jgi:exopolysaccharide biosynthesis polyprenyl glycosylphosphotransferase
MNKVNGQLLTMNGAFLSATKCSRSAERFLRRGYLLLLLISDILVLAVAMRLAYFIRFELKISVAPGVVPFADFYKSLAFVIILGCILLFTLAGLYNWYNLAGGTSEYSRSFNACTIAFLLMVLATFVFQTFDLSRVYLAAAWLFSVLFVMSIRFSLRRIVYILRERGYFRIRTAIVGTDAEGRDLVKELQEPRSGYEVVGLIGINGNITADPERARTMPPFLGTIKNLNEIVEEQELAELVISPSSLPREDLIALYTQALDIPNLELRLATGLFELLTTGVQVQTAGIVPLISVKKLRLSLSELFIKTLVEYMVTIAGLIILAPFIAVIALAVKLDSPGPVLHRRKVLGLGGKQFDAYKFRTMYVDSEKILNEHPELAARLREEEKLKQDPRITSLGGWLRRFSLDELPQLFNVLKGQMSLVGPRMISPPEAEKYSRNRFNLLTVKPGLTGLWQVSGRSDLSYRERIRLDMYYIRNYSIWLDFHILFIKTANAVLRGRGAY